MKLIPVKSSSITGYHYDTERRLLTVEYTGGNRYTYSEVPMSKITAWLKSDSLGKHFNAHIKPHHEAKRVGVE